ncbi:MAG: ribonuclease HIII [Opitutales bacterium]
MPTKKTAKKAASGAPKKKASHTAELTEDELDRLGDWCEDHGWFFFDVDYSRFAYRGEDINVVAYAKPTKAGKYKVVIQGKKTEDFVTFTLEGEITGTPTLGYEEVNHPDWFEAHAGMDESGKGDLFGPVVTCCVVADGDMVRAWRSAGIQDSKNIGSDAAILRLDKLIRETEGVVVKRMALSMPKYNELWAKFGRNLNRLMGWQHAKCLDGALEERSVPWGLLDQFSKRDWTGPMLKSKAFDLRQRTRAEEDPVVAAASICARAEYVRRLKALGEEAGFELKKGASAAVKQQARDLIARHGSERLGQFAKLHFKTAQDVLAGR